VHVLLEHFGLLCVIGLTLFSVFILFGETVELEFETDLVLELQLMFIVNNLEPLLLHPVSPINHRMVIIMLWCIKRGFVLSE